ncbi:hypothetical protein GG344DRAFT_77291 [Lentinula edodes]|nr:hypothetical protein GG344DRAFT_77291 [Lentinula edodes]
MCSFPVGTAPLLTTDSTFVPPITGKGPPFRHLLSTNETPRLFMLIEQDSLPLSLLPECSHLTSFDSIPSTPLPTPVLLSLDMAKQQALHPQFKEVHLDTVGRYICNVGFPTFQLDDPDQSSEDVFIRCETTDKNIIKVNYTKGQEDHHPQSPYPSSGDTVLSCWEAGSQFSYHGCNLEAFSPISCQRCQRGSLTIPDREQDAVVRQHVGQCYAAQPIRNSCYAPRVGNKVLTPDLLDIPQVKEYQQDRYCSPCEFQSTDVSELVFKDLDEDKRRTFLSDPSGARGEQPSVLEKRRGDEMRLR